MMVNDHTRPFWVSKEVLDILNSVSWFALDAAWMFGHVTLSWVMVVPSILTGLCLLYVEKRTSLVFVNLAINTWIVMNCLWMFADTLKHPEWIFYSKIAFFFGVGFIFAAIFTSKDLRDTFSHFKRFRGTK